MHASEHDGDPRDIESIVSIGSGILLAESVRRDFPTSTVPQKKPEDGCLWVYGVGEDGVPAFTKDGIENLRQIVAQSRPRRQHSALRLPRLGQSCPRARECRETEGRRRFSGCMRGVLALSKNPGCPAIAGPPPPACNHSYMVKFWATVTLVTRAQAVTPYAALSVGLSAVVRDMICIVDHSIRSLPPPVRLSDRAVCRTAERGAQTDRRVRTAHSGSRNEYFRLATFRAAPAPRTRRRSGE
jgi:hypothetical protein